MSKRHTLGVSKWLPSTKDKITFKITLRPSTPNISKHLCICVFEFLYIIHYMNHSCGNSCLYRTPFCQCSVTAVTTTCPLAISLCWEKKQIQMYLNLTHRTQLTAPSLPLTAQRIRHLATLIWTAWHLINPMAAENRRQINQMATLVGNVTEVIFTKYVFFSGALG